MNVILIDKIKKLEKEIALYKKKQAILKGYDAEYVMRVIKGIQKRKCTSGYRNTRVHYKSPVANEPACGKGSIYGVDYGTGIHVTCKSCLKMMRDVEGNND